MYVQILSGDCSEGSVTLVLLLIFENKSNPCILKSRYTQKNTGNFRVGLGLTNGFDR